MFHFTKQEAKVFLYGASYLKKKKRKEQQQKNSLTTSVLSLTMASLMANF